MQSSGSFTFSHLTLLLLGLLSHLQLANAWFVTRYFQGEDCRLDSIYCFTQVTPTVSGATLEGTATATATYDKDLTVVRVIVPTDAPVASLSFVTDITKTQTHEYYYMNYIYQPPKSCEEESFEFGLAPFTTEIKANVPSEVTNQVTPTSTYKTTKTAFMTYPASVIVTYYIPTGAAPIDYSEPTAPADCQYFRKFGYYNTVGKERGFDEALDEISDEVDGEFNRRLKTYIIVIIVFVCAMFFFGWVEAYVNFSRLMRGQSARSGNIPFFWVGMIGLVPMLFYICFRSPVKPQKPAHVRKAFRERHMTLSTGQKIRLFLRYGFIRTRPPILAELEREAEAAFAAGQVKVESSTTELVTGPPPAYAPEPEGANRAV